MIALYPESLYTELSKIITYLTLGKNFDIFAFVDDFNIILSSSQRFNIKQAAQKNSTFICNFPPI